MNPLLLMTKPEEGSDRCPICLLNEIRAEHDRTCKDPNCTKGLTADWMIERAADDAKANADTLRTNPNGNPVDQ